VRSQVVEIGRSLFDVSLMAFLFVFVQTSCSEPFLITEPENQRWVFREPKPYLPHITKHLQYYVVCI